LGLKKKKKERKKERKKKKSKLHFLFFFILFISITEKESKKYKDHRVRAGNIMSTRLHFVHPQPTCFTKSRFTGIIVLSQSSHLGLEVQLSHSQMSS
jgi:hypothetical protein